MRVGERSNEGADQTWPAIMTRSVEMSDAGLVVGAGSILARMTKAADGPPRLALDADRERCLAMLSVAWGRPVGADIFHHVEAASHAWQRGDKALANLRLVFAGLPRLAEPADAYRLCLAEYLLDEGMAPEALMRELGYPTNVDRLGKYNPDQQRVPAGNGRRSGEWDFGTGAHKPLSADGRRIVVADDDDPSRKPDAREPARERFGLAPHPDGNASPPPVLPYVIIGGSGIAGVTEPSQSLPASTAAGSLRTPLKSPAGVPPINSPGEFNGVPYSGHSLDQMMNRGIPLSAADQAVKDGLPTPSRRYLGTTNYYDQINKITIMRDDKTGR